MKLFLFLILTCSFGFTQDGEWKYVDGWVYELKKEDPTAGGAIIQKKVTNTNNYNSPHLKSVEVRRTSTSNDKQVKIGQIGNEDVYFSWDERKVFRCMIARMEGQPFMNPQTGKAGTPEPNSNSLLLIGLCFLLLIRNLKRNSVLSFKP